MPLNVSKSKIKHLRLRNYNHSCSLQGKPLRIINKGSDFGVTISSDMLSTKYCKPTYVKANAMLGFIARNFGYKIPGVV